MTLSKLKFREIVFHLLYSADFGISAEDMPQFLMEQHKITKKWSYVAQEVVQKVQLHLAEIEELIKKHAIKYDFERIARVEKTILQLAIFEMIYSHDVPPKVAMSEAVRLARKFATPEGATFVNGVLNAIYEAHRKLPS